MEKIELSKVMKIITDNISLYALGYEDYFLLLLLVLQPFFFLQN